MLMFYVMKLNDAFQAYRYLIIDDIYLGSVFIKHVKMYFSIENLNQEWGEYCNKKY